MHPFDGSARDRLRFHDAAAGRGWMQQIRDAEGLYQRQRDGQRSPLEAYLDRTSVLPGESVAVHLAAAAPATVRCAVYREGATSGARRSRDTRSCVPSNLRRDKDLRCS